VTVAVERRDGWAELRVSDEGPGLPAGAGARLWQPFVQGGGGSHAEGTGLGLAIVRQLVELHDGEVRAGNRPQRGAVFIVRLPIADAGDVGEVPWPAS
jgi:signal transduction histidine kinase